MKQALNFGLDRWMAEDSWASSSTVGRREEASWQGQDRDREARFASAAVAESMSGNDAWRDGLKDRG